MAFDLWSHFHGETMLRGQLADRIADNDALRAENERMRAENERMRSRLVTLEHALELCRTAACAGLKQSGGDSVDETEDGDEAPGT